MLTNSRNLISGFAFLATILVSCADAPAARAGVVNLTRVGLPMTQAEMSPVLKQATEKSPYSISRNENFESPEAVINWNRDCCAELDNAFLTFVVVEIAARESMPPSQSLIVGRNTLLAAHVLLRI